MKQLGGYINYDNRRIFIGNPFSGYHVGIKTNANGQLEIWFSNMLLGKINTDNWLIEPEFKGEKVVFKS
jgi:hypothetical protein